jgi:hypothetical protein
VEGWVPENYLKEEMPPPRPVAPPAPPPAPALRPVPAAVTGRISPTQNKPAWNGPTAPRPPIANGIIPGIWLLIPGGVSGAPTPPAASQTGRKVPPPAPSTRPTGRTANKPPPPAAPPTKSSTAGSRPNLAANLADMVRFHVMRRI